jgi:hypothetical protein
MSNFLHNWYSQTISFPPPLPSPTRLCTIFLEWTVARLPIWQSHPCCRLLTRLRSVPKRRKVPFSAPCCKSRHLQGLPYQGNMPEGRLLRLVPRGYAASCACLLVLPERLMHQLPVPLRTRQTEAPSRACLRCLCQARLLWKGRRLRESP